MKLKPKRNRRDKFEKEFNIKKAGDMTRKLPRTAKVAFLMENNRKRNIYVSRDESGEIWLSPWVFGLAFGALVCDVRLIQVGGDRNENTLAPASWLRKELASDRKRLENLNFVIAEVDKYLDKLVEVENI